MRSGAGQREGRSTGNIGGLAKWCSELNLIRGLFFVSLFMSDFLISIVAVVAVLGFMILVHEFGHYAVAKWLGVRVEVFSIGFGKRLFGFRKGDTDYRVSAIPLGGYVKMSGENPMDERTGDPAEFLSHSRWHRFLIAIAGPLMNILRWVLLAGFRNNPSSWVGSRQKCQLPKLASRKTTELLPWMEARWVPSKP